MSRLRTVLTASVVGGVLVSLSVAPAQTPKSDAAQQRGRFAEQSLLKGNATRIKYPLGRPPDMHEEGENFLAMRRDNYIRPRAFPRQEIDPRGRLRAYEQLQAMRKAQEKRHISAGWLDQPGNPGGVGPGGCAWSSVGPTNINGRVTKIAIDPNSNQRVFVTTVGGIWRSRDGGRRWQRVSDDFLASVFASVAINPGNGNEVVIGGGDPNYASAGSASGLGVWRSTVGGDPATWSKVSPPELDNHVIYRLRYDPVAPNDIYAATSNGVYLGTHAGAGINWARIGGFDASASDLVVDFSVTPRKVYAGVRDASASFARGIWKFDGASWQKRDTGITTSSGRTIALALAPTSPGTIYAKFENGTNGRLLGVFKTTTGGETPGGGGNAWAALPWASIMDDSLFTASSGYSWYNSVLEVDPADANIVYGGGLNIYRTIDGGTNWSNVSAGADPAFPIFVHADHHAVAFDPTNSKVVFVGDDGGIYRSTDTSAATWHWNDISHGMVVTEFYRITSQQATATILAGGSQDNGTEITFGNRTWYQFGGCDGADVAIDGQDSVTVYANCNGSLYEETNPVPGTPGGGSTATTTFPSGLSWTPPVVSDPSLAGRALAAGQQTMAPERLLKTVDGLAWTAASPALPAGDHISFLTIAPSSSFQTYYVGVGGATPTVWRTTNGGTTWATTASGLPSGLWPNAGAVDWTNPARAFVGFGGAAGGGVFVTSDGGANWTGLPGTGAGALPNTAVTGIVVDPNDPNVLYLATAIGAFRGQITPGSPPTAFWSPFDEGLPDGLDLNGIWVNRSTGFLIIGSMGHGTFQRNINQGTTCPAALLVVRDTVFDRGVTPSASGLPDAEHPIPDPARPGFFKPNDTAAGRLYWWNSPDIRIDVPSLDPPANQIASADHVEFETCPIEIASCPPGVMKDSNPVKGRAARAYIQVSNRGIQPASNVRVVALWADATAGLPLLPLDFWSVTFPAGGGPCGPLDNSTGWNFVDPAHPCRTIPVVNPALPEVVGFDWDVPSSAADHSCMLTIVESADDPIDPAVRATNERRPWVFIPSNHQIGNRNLHLVTVSSPQGRPRGLEVINVPNPDLELGHVEVILSRGDLARDARVALLFPPGLQFKAQGLQAVKSVGADLDLEKFAEYHKLDPGTHYVLSKPEARIESLAVPPGRTMKIGLQFDGGAQLKPGTASRFTIMTRQGQTVLGGSTYVLRIPAR
jgi:hypothetical protein